MRQSDYSWMRTARLHKALNPRTMRTTRSFDFTRGVVGSDEGSPKWMEMIGKWAAVRQGGSKVPCWRGSGHILLRVPFSRNGGGANLNQCTVNHLNLHRNPL